jgi:oligopeptide/dipeptide ABC transporter ATP-binding protein
MESQNLLEIYNLKTYFFTRRGVIRAVDGVTFKIGHHENVGLVGESGSGKSVTAYSILRLIDYPGRIIDGKIYYKGENLLEKSLKEMTMIRGKEISIVMQDPMTALNPVYTIGQQIVETLIKHLKLSKKEAKDRAIQLLEMVGIPSAETRFYEYPHKLSGGMRQRVVIAIALSCNPSLLIADEPTTNLDVTTQAEILNLLQELKRKIGMSTLFITHNFGIVAQLCDEVVVMYAGNIVEQSDTISLLSEPLHPYTKALLECIPKKESTGKRLNPIPGMPPNPIQPPSGCKFHPRCKYAIKDICDKITPQLLEVTPGHIVACHLYDNIRGGEVVS